MHTVYSSVYGCDEGVQEIVGMAPSVTLHTGVGPRDTVGCVIVSVYELPGDAVLMFRSLAKIVDTVSSHGEFTVIYTESSVL